MNLIARRRDAQKIIDDDAWDIVVYRAGRTPDDDETTFTCVGRIQPAGARGVPRVERSVSLGGEGTVGRYGWVLLAPYDTDAFLTQDEIVATQRSTSVVRYFTVAYSGRFSYKYEVIIDERQ